MRIISYINEVYSKRILSLGTDLKTDISKFNVFYELMAADTFIKHRIQHTSDTVMDYDRRFSQHADIPAIKTEITDYIKNSLSALKVAQDLQEQQGEINELGVYENIFDDYFSWEKRSISDIAVQATSVYMGLLNAIKTDIISVWSDHCNSAFNSEMGQKYLLETEQSDGQSDQDIIKPENYLSKLHDLFYKIVRSTEYTTGLKAELGLLESQQGATSTETPDIPYSNLAKQFLHTTLLPLATNTCDEYDQKKIIDTFINLFGENEDLQKQLQDELFQFLMGDIADEKKDKVAIQDSVSSDNQKTEKQRQYKLLNRLFTNATNIHYVHLLIKIMSHNDNEENVLQNIIEMMEAYDYEPIRSAINQDVEQQQNMRTKPNKAQFLIEQCITLDNYPKILKLIKKVKGANTSTQGIGTEDAIMKMNTKNFFNYLESKTYQIVTKESLVSLNDRGYHKTVKSILSNITGLQYPEDMSEEDIYDHLISREFAQALAQNTLNIIKIIDEHIKPCEEAITEAKQITDNVELCISRVLNDYSNYPHYGQPGDIITKCKDNILEILYQNTILIKYLLKYDLEKHKVLKDVLNDHKCKITKPEQLEVIRNSISTILKDNFTEIFDGVLSQKEGNKIICEAVKKSQHSLNAVAVKEHLSVLSDNLMSDQQVKSKSVSIDQFKPLAKQFKDMVSDALKNCEDVSLESHIKVIIGLLVNLDPYEISPSRKQQGDIVKALKQQQEILAVVSSIEQSELLKLKSSMDKLYWVNECTMDMLSMQRVDGYLQKATKHGIKVTDSGTYKSLVTLKEALKRVEINGDTTLYKELSDYIETLGT